MVWEGDLFITSDLIFIFCFHTACVLEEWNLRGKKRYQNILCYIGHHFIPLHTSHCFYFVSYRPLKNSRETRGTVGLSFAYITTRPNMLNQLHCHPMIQWPRSSLKGLLYHLHYSHSCMTSLYLHRIIKLFLLFCYAACKFDSYLSFHHSFT